VLSIVVEDEDRPSLELDLDTLVREGARRMLVTALKVEVDAYVAAHAEERDGEGHALVVRNGVAEPRKVTTAAGELEIQAPRVDDRREGCRFTSKILPPWARRSPKVTEVLPVLYLRGISTRDFVPALAEFFGSEAGLSASTVQRLTVEWTRELEAFNCAIRGKRAASTAESEHPSRSGPNGAGTATPRLFSCRVEVAAETDRCQGLLLKSAGAVGGVGNPVGLSKPWGQARRPDVTVGPGGGRGCPQGGTFHSPSWCAETGCGASATDQPERSDVNVPVITASPSIPLRGRPPLLAGRALAGPR